MIYAKKSHTKAIYYQKMQQLFENLRTQYSDNHFNVALRLLHQDLLVNGDDGFLQLPLKDFFLEFIFQGSFVDCSLKQTINSSLLKVYRYLNLEKI